MDVMVNSQCVLRVPFYLNSAYALFPASRKMLRSQLTKYKVM